MGNKSALQLEVEKKMGFEIDEDLFAYLEHYARRKLEVALETIRRWGFQYKTAAFVWVKRNRKSPSWFWGLGNWTRANAEICLLATKGKPKRASASVHSIIDAPIGRHSEKPAETRDRIAQLAGGYQ